MPVRPSENENEYFAREEIKRRLIEQAREVHGLAESEKKRLKELHYLHCPKCGTSLNEENLEGVSVEICPSCRGIWLDDGELAKLTEGGKGFLGSIRGLFS